MARGGACDSCRSEAEVAAAACCVAWWRRVASWDSREAFCDCASASCWDSRSFASLRMTTWLSVSGVVVLPCSAAVRTLVPFFSSEVWAVTLRGWVPLEPSR